MAQHKPTLWPYSVGDRQAQLAFYAYDVKILYPGIDYELAAGLANLCRMATAGRLDDQPAAYKVAEAVLTKAREVAEQALNNDRESDNVHSR